MCYWMKPHTAPPSERLGDSISISITETDRGKLIYKVLSIIYFLRKDTLLTFMRRIERLKCTFVFSWFPTIWRDKTILEKKKKLVITNRFIWDVQTSPCQLQCTLWMLICLKNNHFTFCSSFVTLLRWKSWKYKCAF